MMRCSPAGLTGESDRDIRRMMWVDVFVHSSRFDTQQLRPEWRRRDERHERERVPLPDPWPRGDSFFQPERPRCEPLHREHRSILLMRRKEYCL